jgi:hypothetical protein
MTAEMVVSTSCDQNPHRPRVLHAPAVRATLREMFAVDSSPPSLPAASTTTLLRLVEVGAAARIAIAAPPNAHDRRWLTTHDDAVGVGAADEEVAHDARAAVVCLTRVRSATGARSETAAVMLEAIVRVGVRGGCCAMECARRGTEWLEKWICFLGRTQSFGDVAKLFYLAKALPVSQSPAQSNSCMLGGLRRAAVRPATLAALGIGCIAVIPRPWSASDASDTMAMASSAPMRVTTRLSDIAGARLTKLPTRTETLGRILEGTAATEPVQGTAPTVKASTLWADRPAVVLVLRRPG